MRHPFDGLLGVGRLQQNNGEQNTGMTRRSVLGKMVFATAGVLGGAALARGQQQLQLTTRALGEEGGNQPTTLALGEEGGNGSGATDGPAPATTEPFGEEAGNVTSRMVPGLEDGGAPKDNLPTEAKGEGGGASTEALGEEGGFTKALRERGGPVFTGALNEGGGVPVPQVVQVKPLAIDVGDKELDTVWAEMANENAGKSLQGCAELYGAKEGLRYLKNHLTLKVTEPDEKELEKLILKLDDNEFSTREDAETKLVKLGPTIQPAIEKALKDHKSAEMQMRLNRIVTKFKESNPLRQAEHGVEVLVALRTPEAKQLLEDLAKGDEKDWLAQKAKKALDRVK
jgi:hypothetical protein